MSLSSLLACAVVMAYKNHMVMIYNTRHLGIQHITVIILNTLSQEMKQTVGVLSYLQKDGNAMQIMGNKPMRGI